MISLNGVCLIYRTIVPYRFLSFGEYINTTLLSGNCVQQACTSYLLCSPDPVSTLKYHTLIPFSFSFPLFKLERNNIPIMLYQKSFALLAATITFVAAFPTQVAKRDFTNDVNGNIKLTCKLDSFFLP